MGRVLEFTVMFLNHTGLFFWIDQGSMLSRMKGEEEVLTSGDTC